MRQAKQKGLLELRSDMQRAKSELEMPAVNIMGVL